MVFSTLRITAFNSHIPQVCSCFADYASLENPHLKSKIWFFDKPIPDSAEDILQ